MSLINNNNNNNTTSMTRFHDNLEVSQYQNVKSFWTLLQQEMMMDVAIR